jgi:copper transport protein
MTLLPAIDLRASRIALAGLFMLLALLAAPANVFAHATLVSAQPSDGSVVATVPRELRLTFNEPVSPLRLDLIDPTGELRALDDFALADHTLTVTVPADLADGTHLLAWRVVSADGHPVGGSLVFSVGAPSAVAPTLPDVADGPVAAGVVLSRIGLYVGLVFGIGGAVAVSWLMPTSRSGKRFAGASLAIGLAATMLSIGYQGLDALGASNARLADPLIWSGGLSTSYGPTAIMTAIALLIAIFALLANHSAVSRALSVVAILAGSGALTLSGHASAADPQWLTKPAVFAHAAMAALWVGALGPIGIALHRQAPDARRGLLIFSRFIPLALIVLVAAGFALSVIQVQTPTAIFDTAYGRLLTLKLGLLTLVAIVAIFNRWRLTAPSLQGDDRRTRQLVLAIGVETLLMLAVVCVAAGWRLTPPPRIIAMEAAQPAYLHIHTGQAMADVTISPGRSGHADISAIIMTGEWGPLDARELTFVLSNEAAGIEPIRRAASRPGDGTWRASEVFLPLGGTWTIRLEILVSDFEMLRIAGDVVIRR